MGSEGHTELVELRTGRSRAPVTTFTIALVSVVLAATSLLLYRADTRGEIERARQEQAHTQGLVDELIRQQDEAQQITACRTRLSRLVDLAVLEYLQTIGSAGDLTPVLQRVDEAIEARAVTQETCGS